MVAFGLIQLKIVENDWEGNYRKALGEMERVQEQGADCIILPEMWTSLDRERRDLLAKWSREKLHAFQDWALGHHVYLIFSQLEQSRGHFYNTAYVIAPTGRIVGSYRKIHLFVFGGETDYVDAGNRPPFVMQTPWGLWAVPVCFDLRFPILFRRLARQGVSCFIVPAQWPKEREAHWLALLRARAIENQCVMVGVNRRGKKGKEEFCGASAVFNPWGDCLKQLTRSTARAIVEVDMRQVEKSRSQFPCLALDHPRWDR